MYNFVFFLNICKTMGFEQLAALRDELTQQAATEKLKKRQQKIVKRTHANQASEIDPLVLIIGLLQKTFPLAFPKKPAPKIPLKIGIHKDLLEQTDQLGIPKSELRAAIKTWCWGHRYWDCLVENAVRVDLNGDAAGQVTKVEADQASKLKQRRRKKSAAPVEPTEVLSTS